MNVDFNSKKYKIIYIISLVMVFIYDFGDGYIEIFNLIKKIEK